MKHIKFQTLLRIREETSNIIKEAIVELKSNTNNENYRVPGNRYLSIRKFCFSAKF